MRSSAIQIYELGDQALTIEWSSTINEAANQKVMQAFHYWQKNPIVGVTDMIPAYSSLTLIYDAAKIQLQSRGVSAFTWLSQQINAISSTEITVEEKIAPLIVPVCYDSSIAPDLEFAAEFTNCSVEEFIQIHSSRTYKVYMLGFLPGFAYMASVDKKIRLPRKETPRKLVAAGSVGIAGEQTGIYPLDAPGGWQLIGKTPISLFDISKEDPCFFKPGDRVKFEPISLDAFHDLKNENT